MPGMKQFIHHIRKRLIFLVLAGGLYSVCTAQSVTAERFGQNRVQYKDFSFQYYESDNFVTYFYLGGQDIAKYVIKTAEDESDNISKLLDFRYKKKIDIIVYNDINELNQTNIGIYEPNQTPGGTIKIPDSKIFVYFNGDHGNLDKQIREGIARVYIDKMVQGSGFAEAVQNAILLNLPDWYKTGLEEYVGENWSSDMEDRLRDGILSGRYKKLNKLQPDEAIFVGHAIWHYIDEVHGKTILSNIIYLTRVNRSVDNGFLFVLGTNLSQTLEQWYAYYYDRFKKEESITTMPPNSTIVKTRIRKHLDYYEGRLSPDGKHIAYASNDLGRYKVHLLNTDTHKRKVVMRGGFRTNSLFTDESIPLIAWDPSGKRLAMIRDKRSNIFITFYDMETGKKTVNPIRKFQKVLSFNFVDSRQLVMSAVANGQTDIYLYTIASTTTRKITDDYFDDLDPAYISAGDIHGIMFASNRDDETLVPQRYESQVINKQFDLYFFDLDENALYRVTNTPFANESYPQNLNDSLFCFLSERNGIRNRYVGKFERVFDHNQKTYRFITKESDELDSVQVRQNVPLDSAIDLSLVDFKDSSLEKVYRTGSVNLPCTNYMHNILEQSVVPSKELTLDMFRVNNKVQFREYSVDSIAIVKNLPTMDYMLNLNSKPAGDEKTEAKKPETVKVSSATADSILRNRGKRPFDFQSEYDYGIKLFDWDSATASKINATQEGYVFRFSKVRPYFVRFMTDKVIALFDNNIEVTRYQPIAQGAVGEPFATPSFMFKLGITDLLEDYKIYGGVDLPIPGLTNILQYFLTYENLKKRLDKRLTFYRKSESGETELMDDAGNAHDVTYVTKTNYAELALTYPLDVLNSFRFIFSFRNDREFLKSLDSFSLDPTKYASNLQLTDNWLAFRYEYVFDNCLEVMPNIRYGTRFKVYAEMDKEMPTVNSTLFNEADVPVPVLNNKYMVVVGFDLRHYIKIYKQIIWANRLSGSASFGNDKLLYYLGGLDNWFTSNSGLSGVFNNSTPVNTNGYAFQTLATPLRGFDQNARNGDRFVLYNSELRIPVFAALFNSPIRSEIIRNFQLLGFFDAGSAWTGLSPFANTNPLYNQVITNTANDLIVQLRQYQDPVIFGFGPGARTTLFGYFLRLDVAWGWDSGQLTQHPIVYFSLGTDF